MAFNIAGDGTTTSNVAITSITFANKAVALPNTRSVEARSLLHAVESGFVHGYDRGQPLRRWIISVRLLTAAEARQLETLYDEAREHNWFTWWEVGGTATAVTASTLDDSSQTFNFVDQYRDWAIFITSGTGVGQQRRIANSSNLAPGTRFTVATNWTTNPTGAVYIVGWPVRFAAPFQVQAFGNGLYNADFALVEHIIPDTDT